MSNQFLRVPSYCKDYATISADINASEFTDAHPNAAPRLIRRVRVDGDGELIVTMAGGATETLNVLAGELLELEISKIAAASTATLVKVFW